MRVIGTAGHVDHGKSTLIASLTGVHPDRLKEEQEREMTIDLGFGWLTLPDGEEVGIVDVPGHRDFIENMLAGIGGIDAALLVVAADEGVMPQTREHLAILDLLQIQSGIVVLTKVDLIDDPEWLELIESDLRATLRKTVLDNAPIQRVSARTGQGLDKLVSTLAGILGQRPSRPDLNRPRLPVDRVFSIAGFGTVVTGTLADGKLRLGDEIQVLPGQVKGRVRGLQTHKKKEEIALPGSRTAVNISGISVEQIQRGNVIVTPGHYQPTRRLDARFRLLPDASGPVRHGIEVKLFVGTSETMANLRLLGEEVLNPGDEGWIQIELRDPVVAVRGDRYILRRPSPGETLGGGLIVDHLPKRRYRRFDEKNIQKLEALLIGSPAEIFLQSALALGAAPLKEIFTRSRLEKNLAEKAIEELVSTNQLILLDEGAPSPTSDLLAISASQWVVMQDQIAQVVGTYHLNYPLRRGIPREELKSRMKLSPRLLSAAVKKLVADGKLSEAGTMVAQPGYELRLTSVQKAKVDALLQRFLQTPFAPPTIKESVTEIGEELFNVLVDSGQLVIMSSEVTFRKEDFDTMVDKIKAYLREHEKMTVADVRDLFDTSRRYALALMEHLDSSGVTLRDGDYRRLRK